MGRLDTIFARCSVSESIVIEDKNLALFDSLNISLADQVIVLGKLKRLVHKSEKSKEKSKFQLAPFLGQVDMLHGASCYANEFCAPKGEKGEITLI